MLTFNAAKYLNKALAPRLLRWSLCLHEALASSSVGSSPSSLFYLKSISLLPLAQRLVSIEVQDDCRQLMSFGDPGAGGGFIDEVWSLFFEDRHRKLRNDGEIEREMKRLQEHKRSKRRHRRQQRGGGPRREDGEASLHSDIGERRVRVLEGYVARALLPEGSRSLSRHLFANRHGRPPNEACPTDAYDGFVKWLRGEYLIAKYGAEVQAAVRRHPELRDDAAGLSTLEVEAGAAAPLILPSTRVVKEAFGMQGWTHRKLPRDSLEEMEGGLPRDAKGAAGSKVDLSMERIVHDELGGQVLHSGPLNAYFEMRRREDSYELWTREYVFGLAGYLLDRMTAMDSALCGTPPPETFVLDVGAGDGRLAYFLRRAMGEEMANNPRRRHLKPPRIVATDDGSWRAPVYENSQIRVERLSAAEAVEKYGPTAGKSRGCGETTRLIVLCSWMPPGEDWTADFRRPASRGDDARGLVEEYVLIGEADDGTCGHNWLTWGNLEFLESEGGESDRGGAADVPPYASEGYERVDLEGLSALQFSRFDSRHSNESMTVSFRRLAK